MKIVYILMNLQQQHSTLATIPHVIIEICYIDNTLSILLSQNQPTKQTLMHPEEAHVDQWSCCLYSFP
jgi:hypothetical protein